jgi:hypothetical protein
MFISSNEKLSITLRLTVLEGQIAQLKRSLNAVLDAQTMASETSQVRPTKQAKAKSSRNAYARAYYQRKKYEKLLAKQEQQA